VEFNGARTWKVLGPDLDGHYGSAQGVGALEATVRESDQAVTPVAQDRFGNALATVAGGQAEWTPVRVSGYGPVLGDQAPVLSASAPLAKVSLWRGKRIDPTGFHYLAPGITTQPAAVSSVRIPPVMMVPGISTASPITTR
jgi:hypothetical protein